MGLFDDLFAKDPSVRMAALANLPHADPVEVDAIFQGLFLNEHEGFRWHDRFRTTWFNRHRRRLRTWLNVLLGYVPAQSKAALGFAARLRTLVLGGFEASVVPLTAGFQAKRFKHARSLRIEHAMIDAFDEIVALPALESVTLSHCEIEAAGALALPDTVTRLSFVDVEVNAASVVASTLRELTLCRSALPLSALDGVDDLGQLVLRGHPLTDLADLPVLPGLSFIVLAECPNLASFTGLDRQPGLTILSVDDAPRLATLEGLPAELMSLDLRGVQKLRSLAGVPRVRDAKAFTVTGANALTRVGPVAEAMPKLERLTLGGLRRKRVRLDDLAALGSLQVLDLRGSPGVQDVSAFLDHESLRALLLNGTGVDRSAVPPRDRWRCSWAQSPNVEELVGRTPPARATWDALKGEGRTLLAKIRKLVRAADPDIIEQGLELLGVVDDPHIYDALLEGADYRQVRLSSRLNRRPWRLGSRRFVGPTRAYVLHRLLADAPPESTFAAALRDNIHTLDFVEPYYPAKPHPLDLKSLAALPHLTSLSFARFGPLQLADDDDPGVIAKLDTLEIHHPQGTIPRAWLAAQTNLRHLKLFGDGSGSRDLTFVKHLPNLEKLEIAQQSQLDLSQLQDARSLKELTLASCPSLTSLEGLPDGLETVRVSWCWQLADLGPLLDMDSLQAFRLYGCSVPQGQIAMLEGRGVTKLR